MNCAATAFDDPLWWKATREYLRACIEGRIIPPPSKGRV
jgi:hypothetical protein